MKYQGMTVSNRIKELVDGMNKTRYQFWKETGLAQNTAYRLYDEPGYIPGPTVMDKICKTYVGVQPGDFIVYIPDDELPVTTAEATNQQQSQQRQEPDRGSNSKDDKRTRSSIAMIATVPESA